MHKQTSVLLFNMILSLETQQTNAKLVKQNLEKSILNARETR